MAKFMITILGSNKEIIVNAEKGDIFKGVDCLDNYDFFTHATYEDLDIFNSLDDSEYIDFLEYVEKVLKQTVQSFSGDCYTIEDLKILSEGYKNVYSYNSNKIIPVDEYINSLGEWDIYRYYDKYSFEYKVLDGYKEIEE